jgi:anionic cell wall polymer biosynthesis LytR-Cps2A-Psr (LCP) family protein
MPGNSTLSADMIKSVTNQIHKKYPEFAGVAPKVRRQAMPKGNESASSTLYLFTFNVSAHAADNVTIPRSVRVTVNDKGKIIKITTSR